MTILQVLNAGFMIIHRMLITSIGMEDGIIMRFNGILNIILTESITQHPGPLDNIQLNGVLRITLGTEVAEVLAGGSGHWVTCLNILNIHEKRPLKRGHVTVL
jgi:hypothetical protein